MLLLAIVWSRERFLFLPSGRGRMFSVQTDEESLCCGLLCHAPIGLVALEESNIHMVV